MVNKPTYALGYEGSQPHVAAQMNVDLRHWYDPNGNMTVRVEISGGQRITYTQGWDIDNRLVAVTSTLGYTTTFAYDADGQRVMRSDISGTTVYVGQFYEVQLSTGITTSYYTFGAQRVAMRTGSNVYWIHADHLGSASLTTDVSGAVVSEMRYYPFGEVRWISGTMPTDHTFTGQRAEGSLMDYGARFYSPLLGRFLSADSIVPQPGDPQNLNRYSYVRNSPLRFMDPSGHCYVAGTPNTVPSQWCGQEIPASTTTVVTPQPDETITSIPVLTAVRVATPYVRSTPHLYVINIKIAPPVDGTPHPEGTGLPDDGWEWSDNWRGLGRGWRNREDPEGAVWRPDIPETKKGAKEGEDPHWHRRLPGNRGDGERIPVNPGWGRGTNDRREPGTYNPDTGRYEALTVSIDEPSNNSVMSYYVSPRELGPGTFYVFTLVGIIGGAAGVYYWQPVQNAYR